VNVVELSGSAVGGIRHHVTELVRQLRARGVEVRWCGPQDSGAEDRVDVPSGFSPVMLFRGRRQLRQLLTADVQVVHVHGLKAALLAILAGGHRPIIYTVHNVVEGSGHAGPIPRFIETTVCRRADHLIVASPAVARHCAQLAPRTPCSLVLPVFSPPVVHRDRGSVRRVWGIESETSLVVSVARLHPQKRLDLLLDAWERIVTRLPDARLVLVGDGPERERLQHRCRQLAGVQLVGTDVAGVDAIAASDALVITSGWEGIPFVALEAMSLGVPVVSTDVGVVAEVIVPGAGRVVPEGHGLSERFAAAVIEQLGADRSAVPRGDAIDLNSLVDQVIEVYRTVVER